MANSNSKSDFSKKMAQTLATEKKKIVIVSLLLIVMAVMWGKMLKGKVPAKASAVTVSKVTESAPVKLAYVDLEMIEGRNDRIARDIFSSKDFKGFSNTTIGGENIVSSGNIDSEDIQVAASQIRLIAILSGDEKEAVLNDSLLKAGESFKVESADLVYEFTVTAIFDNKIVLSCREVEITVNIEPSK